GAAALGDQPPNPAWLAFVRSLGVPDPGTLASIVELLERDAARDDVVLSNFGWDALYWYAERPIGMRIATDAPVRRAAQRLGLPESVFEYDHAAWLVWRGENEIYLGYPLTLLQWRLPEVRAALAARGARLRAGAAGPRTRVADAP